MKWVAAQDLAIAPSPSAELPTDANVPPAEETEHKQAAATAIQPVDDLVEPTGSDSEPESQADIAVIDYEGWSFFSVLPWLLAAVAVSVLFWWACGARWAKRLMSGRERANYRKVNTDLEK